MPLEFISNLSEARLFPEGKYSLRFYNGKDITNLMFLHMLGIQILKYENLILAKKYISDIEILNHNYWMSSKNELYACLHLINGTYNHDTHKFLKDYKEAEVFLNRIVFHELEFKKYIRLLNAGVSDGSYERRYFVQLQQDLRITDSYMINIRGYASNWLNIPSTMRKIVLQRLLQFMRVMARESEMTHMLEITYQRMHVSHKELPPMPTIDSPALQNVPVREGLFPFIKK